MKNYLAILLAAVAALFVPARAASAATIYPITHLGGLRGYFLCEGLAINAGGQVTGFTSATSGVTSRQPFLYSGGVMKGLGILPGYNTSSGTAINSSGQVAGYAGAPSGVQHALLYSGGTITDIGILPGFTSGAATGISDSGQIAGYAYNGSSDQMQGEHAFLYNGGAMTDMGTAGYADKRRLREQRQWSSRGASRHAPERRGKQPFFPI